MTYIVSISHSQLNDVCISLLRWYSRLCACMSGCQSVYNKSTGIYTCVSCCYYDVLLLLLLWCVTVTTVI